MVEDVFVSVCSQPLVLCSFLIQWWTLSYCSWTAVTVRQQIARVFEPVENKRRTEQPLGTPDEWTCLCAAAVYCLRRWQLEFQVSDCFLWSRVPCPDHFLMIVLTGLFFFLTRLKCSHTSHYYKVSRVAFFSHLCPKCNIGNVNCKMYLIFSYYLLSF